VTRATTALRLFAGVAGLTVATASPLPAQEIVQAVVIALTAIDVQVIVAATRGDEEVRCLGRAPDGTARVAATERVSKGFLSGRTTVLSLLLPLLDPRETEYSVVLARGATVLDQTEWRPLLR
jgi:hypothetical protein